MEPVSGVDSVAQNASSASVGDAALASLATKVASGDLMSECMALFAEDSACQAKTGLQGIRIQKQAIKQARQRKMELLKKRMKALKESGFWSRLCRVFNKLVDIVSSAVGIFCAPAGAAIKAGGLLASIGFVLASASWDNEASRAAADALKVDHSQQEAKEACAELVKSLQDAANAEQRMAARITAMAENEKQVTVMK